MTQRNRNPILTRHIEKNGEMFYIIVERLSGPEIAGDLSRLKVHYHRQGSNRQANWDNATLKDETGNRYDLRLSLVKFLLEKRDDGWSQRATSSTNENLEDARFWSLEI